MSKETKILPVLTYNQSLPNIGNIGKSFKETFQYEPITAFICNKNLRELIGCNKIKHNKVKKHTSKMKQGNCSLCLIDNRSSGSKQVFSSSTSKSQWTNKSDTIYTRSIVVHIFLYKQLSFFGQAFGCISQRTISGLKLLKNLLTN